ncbi:Uncharacterised protein [Orientia tsutsugamushi str. Gilliam]|uniref:Cytoplasmic protein n=1 Tax=Orientia tsutsugamushi str. Gilliam TaxID=1359184 RepID=A0A2U3QQI0_ORITS|nr:cell cycle transcriptional regulator TrcR [Orientia tsutsugamushi]SPR03199.1 Uncharacterised protein [Orientia tsutsugamushi str. Gilliam]
MVQNKKKPIMPIATAIWLIDNTALTFKQIAEFCGMHELEIKNIANGEVAQGIKPINPILTNQLTQEEIDRCSNNSSAVLQLHKDDTDCLLGNKKVKRVTRYTPIARRHDKPDAIYWLLRTYPDIQDYQIIKLVGTTKTTIKAIREKTHWNMKDIHARDPVLLGLCNQMELDTIVKNLSSSDNKSKLDTAVVTEEA